MTNTLLNEDQKQKLKKYGISCEDSINAILEKIQEKTLEIGYYKGYAQMNDAGYELERLFDELFPLGEDEYE